MDSEQHRRGCLLKIGLLAGSSAGIFLLLTILVAMALAPCDLLAGFCSYDPRTQHPPALFFLQPPEPFVAQYVQKQIAQTGTFPPGAPSKALTLTPVKVWAYGFKQYGPLVADTLLEIRYADGSSQMVDIRAMAKKGVSVWGTGEGAFHAEFGQLWVCEKIETISTLGGTSGVWYCE